MLLTSKNSPLLFVPDKQKNDIKYWKKYLFDSATMPNNKCDYFGILIGNTMYQLYKYADIFYLQSGTDIYQLPSDSNNEF